MVAPDYGSTDLKDLEATKPNKKEKRPPTSSLIVVLLQGVMQVGGCVEISQCVGCTRQFFTKSFLGDRRWPRPGSVERRGTGIATPSSKRRVDGVEVDAATQHEGAVKF